MFLSLLVLTLCGMMRTFLASACTFPFIYEARKFSSCIANGRTDRMYWCATTRNYDRDKKWEFCPEADLPENSSVAFCTIPFIFEGKKFFSCTTEGRMDGRYWCATTENYDKDGQWILCSGSEHHLRLMNGGDPCAGRVELHYTEGGWGTVCNHGWDLTAATLVCKELKCGTAIATSTNSQFGESDGPIWVNQLHCLEIHAQLQDCEGSWVKRGSAHSCDHANESGVVCSDYGKVRLVNGTGRCLGRVEIFFSHRWGTVCDSIWGIQAAEVVCRQLGCGHAKSQAGGAHFGEGSGPIWLDSIQCTGAESHLWQCDSKRVGEHSCSHQQDVGVTCEGPAQRDIQSDMYIRFPLVPVIAVLLIVPVVVFIAWIIKRKTNIQQAETNIEHKELDEAPDSLYENIEWVRN
ncbi:CD5 antigen-like isoform X1 [Pleurodeles waltl]